MMRARLCALLLMAAAGGPVAAQTKVPEATPAMRPTADFARLPFLDGPQLSPNGQYIAARMAQGGKQYLAIIPLSASSGAPRIVEAGTSDLNWWRWVNDDWLTLGLGNSTKVQGEDWYITRAAALSADAKTIRILAKDVAGQNADDAIWFAHDGTPRILLSLQRSIYSDDPEFWAEVIEVNLATNKNRLIVKSTQGVMSWYADGNGTVRMGIGQSDNGRSSRMLYRASASESFRIVDRANTRTDDNHLLAPALFLADPGKALAYRDDSDGYGALYEFDLATLQLGKQVAATKGFDLGTIITDASGYQPSGVRTLEDRPGVKWFDPELAKIQAAIDKAIGAKQASIVSFSHDNSRLLVHVGSVDEPGAYYVYDDGDGTLHLLGYVDDHFKSRMHPVSTIRYKARDGLEIAAVLTLPKGREARNLPLIVMPHGGPYARDIEGWDWWSQFLADRGYAVVQPNYRGSSGYGTGFTRKGEGQWGLAMQDDLNDAITHLAKIGVADPKRVCMVGASYGGYAAMRAAQRDGALYRCAVSYAGVSDLVRMKRYDSNFLNSGVAIDWLQRQAPDLRSVSPLNNPEQFSIPILIVHGKEDRRVPIDQSRDMAARLRKMGKDVTYIEQPLADHFFSREQDRLQFLEALEVFLKQHNPADPAPVTVQR